MKRAIGSACIPRTSVRAGAWDYIKENSDYPFGALLDLSDAGMHIESRAVPRTAHFKV
jgi:hypothetical protein